MKKVFTLLLCISMFQFGFSQQRTVTGTITDANSNEPISSASIVAVGSFEGTQTDKNGKFSINVSTAIKELEISYVGYNIVRLTLDNSRDYNIKLEPSALGLENIVVTALGISREKKSLGYSTQEVRGDDVDPTNSGDVTSALSGKVSGVQIRTNTGLGGSSNIIIRGIKSFLGDNQALFVVDGVPIDNSNATTSSNSYDYGNLASDLNPDDVESINVLKGAAATALYGSRASNGAVIITTKKGKSKTNGIGVTINSGIKMGNIDRSTLVKYQREYGAAYGPVNGPAGDQHFNLADINGDGILDQVIPYNQYGGFGAAYDPNLLIYQWPSYYPESPLYKQATPWVAPPEGHGPEALFRRSEAYTNSISFGGNNQKSNYRLSYSNFVQNGIMPNSRLIRHNFSINVSNKITDRLTVEGSLNYVNNTTEGRTERGTGNNYSNMLVNMRQYWQPNIDFKEVDKIYQTTGKNITQFPTGTIDNPFFVLYENGQSDQRDRIIGNASLSYDIFDWLQLTGRISLDQYSYIMEERQNNLIRVPARYTVRNNRFHELNYDLMLRFNKKFGDKLDVSGLLGGNYRRNKFQSIYNTTNNGLIVPKLFAIANSLGTPPPASENLRELAVNGHYALLSLGYANTYYLDLTGRVDRSSTLPVDKNSYFYPSISTSIIFSNWIKSSVLSFGKLRLNYAEVGNSAPVQSLEDVLVKPVPFGAVQLYNLNSRKNNPQLKPERTSSYEIGVESGFLKNRVNFNFTYYRTVTKDQIMPVLITPATGYSSKYVNSGKLENKGVELSISGEPVKTKDFTWNIGVNWSKNKSKVLELFEGIDNLLLSGLGGFGSLNAPLGKPYGIIFGSDYVYVNGQPLVNQSDGKYVRSQESDIPIGDVNPSWIGGINNTVTYKKLSFRFLIDFQHGGSIYSEDFAVGSRNGLLSNTVGLNELGNPVRDPISQGGGMLLPGVDQDGKPNEVRTEMVDRNHALGAPTAPTSMFVFDASYVKLREVAITYNFSPAVLKQIGIIGLQASLVGSNLWIIKKNLPYADPEAGFSSGNLSGFQTGVYPAVKYYGLNLKLNF